MTATSVGSPAVAPTSTRATLELIVVGVGALVVSLSQTLLIPVISTLPVEIGTSATNVTWLLTSTLMAGAVSVPIMGRLGDMFGKRLMLMVALGAMVVGSLITALTDNIGVLIFGRAIQGISLAAIPLGISLLSVIMPRERVGSSIALISAMLGVGGSLGLPLAGFIGEHFDYHALFWITAVAGFASLVGILLLVPEAPGRSGGRVDYVGSALIAATLIALLLPLTQSATWGWSDPRIALLLLTSLALLLVLGWSQTRIREPLVDLKALAKKPIIITNLASILFGFALFASLIGTASYVVAPPSTGYGFGSSLMVGGLAMLPGGIAMLLFSPVAARMISTRGAPQTLALGAMVVSVGWVGRIVFTDSLWQVVVGATCIGIGTGIGYAAMPSLINSFTPPSKLGAANGLNTLFRNLGSSLASAAGGAILAADVVLVDGFAAPSLTAYRQLFALCCIASIGAAALILLIKRPEAGSPTD